MPTFSELDLLGSKIEPGLTVIEASAGTGKTYSISHLVPRLLLEGALPDLSQLLLVTFTRDAARELAERVRRVLAKLAAPAASDEPKQVPHIAALRPLLENAEARTRLNRALLDLDLLAVSTIHAFCQRTLQQEGSLCGMPVLPEVTTDDSEHLNPIVHELWVSILATDATTAALATALGWKLSDALKLINSLRRAQSPKTEPALPTFDTLRANLKVLSGALTDSESFESAMAILGRVEPGGWNKGIENAAEVIRRLRPLQNGSLETLSFWQSLAFAAEVPGKVKATPKMGKTLRAEIAAHPWFTALDRLFTLTQRLEWAWQQHLAAEAIPKLAVVMAQRRLITQDGLIGALYRALHRTSPEGAEQSARLAAHLAARYQVALIDESQDTDPRQLAIFQRIFNHPDHRRRLILVGDPKQAIYSFRGADLSTYLAARTTADAGYTLTHTHRAPAPLVKALNQLFQRPQAFHHPDMQFKPAESALAFDRRLLRNGQPCSRLEAWIVPEADQASYSAQGRRVTAISAQMASTMVDLLQHGKIETHFRDGREREIKQVTPKDFAVLVSTNSQAEAMAAALQARAVPVVINSGSDVFASEEASELHLLLHALLDPRKLRLQRSALATRLLGLDATSLADLDQVGSDGQQPSLVWQERFQRWHQTWMVRGLAALFTGLEQLDIGLTRRLALVPLTGERRATNYRQLTDLLLEATRDEAPRPEETVRWLGQQIARAEERSQSEERQLQLSSDREAVQIVTMHKAKGLEYPLVFCPFLAESIKEHKGVAQISAPAGNAGETSSDLLIHLDLLDDTNREARVRELMAAQLEERLRLAYVALTRAQVRAWICVYSGTAKSDHGSALDWLLRSDADLSAYSSYSAAWVESAKTNRSDHHRDVLLALGAKRHDDALPDTLITFRDPPLPTEDRFKPQATTEAPKSGMSALAATIIPPSWRVTSFSTLTKEKHAHGAVTPAEPVPSTPASLSAAPAALFLNAPGGAAVGTVVHDWIETWDLTPIDSESFAQQLNATRLPAPRKDQPNWTDALSELFSTLRVIRLPGYGDTPLHEICPEPHGSEWHFHLPIASALSVGALARCFEEHAAPDQRSYAASLAALSDEKFHGLLQGFIDRLARVGPAWGVIDWKTNRLGSTLADYDQAGLLNCAMRDHYLLQTHLYLVALRRYLRALGLGGQKIAGAWLVFLRAIAPEEARGVLHINPSEAMLDALDQLFAPASQPIA